MVKITEIQATPNPNAMKISIEPALAGGTKSYFNWQAAAGDPLAARLFEVDGVIGVMLLGGFITISKHRDVEWAGVLAGVRGVLAGWTTTT